MDTPHIALSLMNIFWIYALINTAGKNVNLSILSVLLSATIICSTTSSAERECCILTPPMVIYTNTAWKQARDS